LKRRKEMTGMSWAARKKYCRPGLIRWVFYWVEGENSWTLGANAVLCRTVYMTTVVFVQLSLNVALTTGIICTILTLFRRQYVTLCVTVTTFEVQWVFWCVGYSKFHS
jgi:hypothetical protein